jgi:hypothetical protein
LASSAPSRPDIFLSYAREDQARAGDLAAALEQHGLTVFWDREVPPGQTWHSSIGAALTNARCVIVAWSRHSIAPQWAIEEASEGKDRTECDIGASFPTGCPPYRIRSSPPTASIKVAS